MTREHVYVDSRIMCHLFLFLLIVVVVVGRIFLAFNQQVHGLLVDLVHVDLHENPAVDLPVGDVVLDQAG